MSISLKKDVNEVTVPELARTLNGKCATRSATRELMQSLNYVVMRVCDPTESFICFTKQYTNKS